MLWFENGLNFNAEHFLEEILLTDYLAYYFTPQPNCSKVFELQQSNQGYGETQGAQEFQKNTFGKYFTEPFLR